MRLREVQRLLDAVPLNGHCEKEKDVFRACSADLLSDVLVYSKADSVLLTGLVHEQVMRTADMLDLAAVIVVRGKPPSENMIQYAEEKGIPLFKTTRDLYSSAGVLYVNGLRGYGINILAGELALIMDMELLQPGMSQHEMRIDGCYIGDLLSNVMGNAKSGQLWMTIMNNINVVAVAQLLDLSGIVLLENNQPGDGFLERAEMEGIPVFLSKAPAYAAAVKLFDTGLAK